jgi:hypothetical protein
MSYSLIVPISMVRWVLTLKHKFADLLFYDPVPMEEVVRAFNWVIEKGWVRKHNTVDF